jgi:hypothetical protein
MKTKDEIEAKAKLAILELRREKHKNGHPFMINSSTLPDYQCWLEYPSGEIHLVELSKSRADFDIVKVLSIKESDALRRLLNL